MKKQLKGISIIEVVCVFLLWRIGLYFLWFFFQINTYGLCQFAVPIMILLITRRNFADYGFTTRNWAKSTDIGLLGYLLTCFPVAGMILIQFVGGNYHNILEGIVIAIFFMLAIVFLLVILQKQDKREVVQNMQQIEPTIFQQSDQSTRSLDSSPKISISTLSNNEELFSEPDKGRLQQLGLKNILTIAILLVFPTIVAIILQLPSSRIGDVAYWSSWQFVVSGFGEEILFRGYIQSRVNSEYGKPWVIKGIHFGPGLLIAAILFGIVHILNPYNPLGGDFTLAWGWGISSFVAGVFFGLIREKTGDIIGPGIVHGLPDAVGESLYLIITGAYI